MRRDLVSWFAAGLCIVASLVACDDASGEPPEDTAPADSAASDADASADSGDAGDSSDPGDLGDTSDLAGDGDASDLDTTEPNDASDLVDATDGSDALDVADASDDGDGEDTLSWVPKCGVEPCPIVIESFPYQDTRATDDGVAAARFEGYACAPTTDESGPEYVYVFRLEEPGTVIAGITDGSGVDIDVHLLEGFDAATCVARGHIGLSAHLEPGTYYLTADSWVDGGGVAQAGEYTLTANFLADSGPCALASAPISRIGGSEPLAMPATGMVVKEAHLVTAEEAASFPSGWPTSITDGIPEHYALSESVSGYVMARTEPWAPCCEPSNEYGQGSSVKPPAEAEAWYVNMRWSSAPARGERYIVINPVNGRAVVGAAGYENGPGDLSRVGGASEEVHDALGTGHLDHLTFGVALDQSLPFGPIECVR